MKRVKRQEDRETERMWNWTKKRRKMRGVRKDRGVR
jgi:hypothetical protein